MCCRDARRSRAIISKDSAERRIRVPIRNRIFVPKTGKDTIFTFGEEGAGFCLTAKRRTDTFVFPKKDSSGVGRHRHTLLRCHAEPIEVMGGVGEMRSVIAMIADRRNYGRFQRCLMCFGKSFPSAAIHFEINSRGV